MSALANINVQDFRKRVEDHVLNTFGSLIPPEQFEAMVNAEIKSFFEGSTEIKLEQIHSGYNSGRVEALKTSMTPFRAVVYAKILSMIGKQLDEFFSSEHAPVKKMLAELTALPEVQDHQMSQAQKMMLAMAGVMFSNVMNAANINAVGAISQAFRNCNMYDIANAIGSQAVYTSPTPEVSRG